VLLLGNVEDFIIVVVVNDCVGLTLVLVLLLLIWPLILKLSGRVVSANYVYV
jgi:hypothetical protein